MRRQYLSTDEGACAGSVVQDCTNTEAVNAWESQLTLQRTRFSNNFVDFNNAGVLAIDQKTSTWVANTTFEGTNGFDVILRSTNALMYTDTPSAYAVSPASTGELRRLAQADASFLARSDPAFAALRQVCTVSSCLSLVSRRCAEVMGFLPCPQC